MPGYFESGYPETGGPRTGFVYIVDGMTDRTPSSVMEPEVEDGFAGTQLEQFGDVTTQPFEGGNA